MSSLCWSADSLYLVSADAHGTMYSWSMERLARAEESVIKGSDYTCVLYNHDRTALVACGASTPLRVFDTGKQLAAAEAAQPGPDPSPAAASASIGGKTSAEALQRAGSALGSRNGERGRAGPLVAVSPIIRTNIVSEHFGGHSATVWMAGLFSRALLATGARNGALSLRQYPLASDGSRASPELFLHGGPLTGLCCVEAAGLVFSAGVDGIVFVAAVAGHREAASNQAAEAAAAPLGVGEEAPTDTLVMVKKSMLQEEEREREELRWGLQKLSDEAAYKLHRVEQDAAARLREHDEARERAEMGLRQRVKEHEKAAIEAEERYQTTLAAERQHKEEAVKETQQRGDIKVGAA